jgi:hypothetical protein
MAEKSKRLSNADVSKRLTDLITAAEKERNLRTVRENVQNRENAFQLDGIIQKLKAMRLQFDLFTNPPKAQ